MGPQLALRTSLGPASSGNSLVAVMGVVGIINTSYFSSHLSYSARKRCTWLRAFAYRRPWWRAKISPVNKAPLMVGANSFKCDLKPEKARINDNEYKALTP